MCACVLDEVLQESVGVAVGEGKVACTFLSVPKSTIEEPGERTRDCPARSAHSRHITYQIPETQLLRFLKGRDERPGLARLQTPTCTKRREDIQMGSIAASAAS